jgi:small-conductance mechanosensitive channel/CRP-like cAMP-binding protein
MTPHSILNLVLDPVVGISTAAIIGSLLIRVTLRKQALLRLLVQAAFLVVLSIFLFDEGIVPYATGLGATGMPSQAIIGVVKIIWWMNAAWVLAGIVRVFLIIEQQPSSGRLIQDLVIGMIYLGAGLSIIAYVFGVPVGTLVATSGVVAVIMGLALQSTLSDVFSGIALNIGRPYSVGDWIVLNDGIEGRVLETNWRATHLLNGSDDLVVLPNSSLAKATITNMSSPERSHGAKLRVWLRPTRTPGEILDAMHNVLLSCNTVLKSPPPTVQVRALTGVVIEIELSFRVPDISTLVSARNEVFDLIHRHALAVGLRLAQAPDVPVLAAPDRRNDASQAEPEGHRTTAMRLIDNIPLFASLTADEKEALATTMTRRTYRKDEVVAQHGAVLRSLTIVRSGVLIVSRREAGQDVEIGRLAPGDFLGEGGLLTGSQEIGTTRALTFVVAYEIDHVGLAPLMHDRPQIAEELALTFARRRERNDHLDSQDQIHAEPRSVQAILARIRDMFGVNRSNGV